MGSILNEMKTGLTSTLRDLRVYLLGRGIITTTSIAAGFMSSAFLTQATVSLLSPVAAIAIVGGLALSGVMRVREMRFNQDRMADIYRHEIADQLGIAPQQVSRQHVHMLAFGDERRGIPGNPILREEIDREWNRTWLKFATSALAAMASFGLIYFGSALEIVGGALPTIFGETAGKIIGMGTLGIVTGFTGLLLNNGLDLTIQNMTTLGNRTLHDRIARLDDKVSRGHNVSKEQVFALFVAADPELDQRIKLRFGKTYDALHVKQQTQVIDAFGLTDKMQVIAGDVSARRISAGTLAFVLTGQHALSMTPDQTRAHGEPVQQQPQHEREQERPRFADRVAQPRGKEGLTHSEREQLRRATTQLETAAR